MRKVWNKALFFFWGITEKSDAKRKAKQTPAPGITKQTDIPYLPDGKTEHLLDIYYPEGTKAPLPVIIDIHGGGWMYGNKELNEYYCLDLAAGGYTVINLNYTLAPEGTIDRQAADLFAAFRWIEAHSADYFCDLDRVLLTGDSAGGHLTLLAASICGREDLQALYGVKPPAFRFSALGITCGASDLSTLYGSKLGIFKEYARFLLGSDYKNSKFLHAVNASDLVPGAGLPPVYMMSSSQDFLHFQSLRLDAVLEQNGVPHQFHDWGKVKGKTLAHVFPVLFPEWEESRETTDEMLTFWAAHAAAREPKAHV